MSSELAHSGILGMKWGVRRYQNRDGTLTRAGKMRYGRLHQKYLNKVKREAKWNPAWEQEHEQKIEKLQKMSNREFWEKYVNHESTPEPSAITDTQRRAYIAEEEQLYRDWRKRAETYIKVQKELMKLPVGQLKSDKEYKEFIRKHGGSVFLGILC